MGIEASKSQATYARDELHLPVEYGDKLDSYGDGIFDFVTIFEVLEHIEKPREFLMTVRRVLKPGGYLLISIPNAPFQFLKARIFKFLGIRKEAFLGPGEHIVHYTRKTIKQFLRNVGFSIVKIENSRMVLGPRTSDFKFLKLLYQPLADSIFQITGCCIARGLFVIAIVDKK